MFRGKLGPARPSNNIVCAFFFFPVRILASETLQNALLNARKPTATIGGLAAKNTRTMAEWDV